MQTREIHVLNLSGTKLAVPEFCFVTRTKFTLAFYLSVACVCAYACACVCVCVCVCVARYTYSFCLWLQMLLHQKAHMTPKMAGQRERDIQSSRPTLSLPAISKVCRSSLCNCGRW